eukprot:scaffold85563_cov26-Tisochrysis_lutea.AAC.1
MLLPAALTPAGYPAMQLKLTQVSFDETGLASSLLVPVLESAASPDELIQIAIENEEFDIYSAQVWPSSVAAATVLLRALAARTGHVCELGCGPALPSLAALAAGAERVVATDWSEYALGLAQHASSLQLGECGRAPSAFTTAKVDVFDPEWPLPVADYYVVADMLYEADLASAVGRRLTPVLMEGATAIVADPFRLAGRGRAAFLEGLQEEGHRRRWTKVDDVVAKSRFVDETLPKRWRCLTTGADTCVGVCVLSATKASQDELPQGVTTRPDVAQ